MSAPQSTLRLLQGDPLKRAEALRAPGSFNRPHTSLPVGCWTGDTRRRCLQPCHGPVAGRRLCPPYRAPAPAPDGQQATLALLAGLDPAAVHRWYLAVYIDAFEGVKLPTALGMSQFAHGGLLATKPCLSSAACIDRMSGYCPGCPCEKKLKTGKRACLFNAVC